MTPYALVDPKTGAIRQTGAAPDREHIDLQARATGMLAIEITPEVSQETHWWDGKAFVPFPEPRPAEWAEWDGAAWTDPRSDSERKAAEDHAHRTARLARDRMLAESDWTQLPDAPLTDDQRAAWRDYRQALRDAPATGLWPDKPE